MSSPSSVRTPVTCTIPSGPVVVNTPATATPRRMVRPGVAAAIEATTDSPTGRRAVTFSNRSSPSCHPPVTSSGMPTNGFIRSAPAAHMASVSPGSSTSATSSEPGEEEVDHPELVDTLAVPFIPRLVGCRRRRRITLQHRHLVTVVGQHHRCARSDDAATCEHDSSHEDPLYLPIHPSGVADGPRQPTFAARRATEITRLSSQTQ